MFMLRIRFDTFCTVPVIASSAPMRWAKRISEPPQACRLLAAHVGILSTRRAACRDWFPSPHTNNGRQEAAVLEVATLIAAAHHAVIGAGTHRPPHRHHAHPCPGGPCRDAMTKITDVHIDRLRPFQASRTSLRRSHRSRK